MRNSHDNPGSQPAFALVVTLTLMLLLVILGLGLLSLSAVSLRTSGRDKSLSVARANARVALQIALGELQKQMGPDQRVSARGAILSDSSVQHPHWTGVWDSWIADSISLAPVTDGYPSAESHHRTIGNQPDESMRPEYGEKAKHFRAWLLSLGADEAADPQSPVSLALYGVPMPSDDQTAVRLVGAGSLGQGADTTDFVSARLIDVAGGDMRSRYAWWVGDESQKARIMADPYERQAQPPTPLTSADRIFRSQAPGSTGTKSFADLEELSAAQEAKIEGLPSPKTLDLLVNDEKKRPAQKNFHSLSAFSRSVLADVREGGLKRDLSVLLEQPIDRANNTEEYMLYEFDDPRFPGDRSNSRVPIQDLAAYHQLYDHVDHTDDKSSSRREGVQFDSTKLPDSIQIRVPDYDGGKLDRQRYLREYTSLYRQPVVAKIQFLLAVGAQPITGNDRLDVLARMKGNNVIKPVRDSDTHKLRVGVIPMITMWNPNNIPLVFDRSQYLRIGAPPFALRWRKYRAEKGALPYTSLYFNLYYAMGVKDENDGGGGNSYYPFLMNIRFANTDAQQLVFKPGEVKVFSVPSNKGGSLKEGGNAFNFSNYTIIDPVNSWDPSGFFLTINSAPEGGGGNQSPDVSSFKNAAGGWEASMVFEAKDSIAFEVVTEGDDGPGRRVSQTAEVTGAGFQFAMMDNAYEVASKNSDFLRHYQMLSAYGYAGKKNSNGRAPAYAFNTALLTPGFPGGKAPIDFEAEGEAISGEQLINASDPDTDEVIALMEFSLSVGCESGSAAVGGFSGGRRIASRPFLHSSPSVAPLIDSADRKNLYNYGWDWQLGKVNTVEDSIIQAKPDTGNGFHGGGYTVEAGTTHVVQRDLPVLPPISIASLSHAQLGGYSLAYAAIIGDNPETDSYNFKAARFDNPVGADFQKVTASGQGGLAPQMSQAIGNSYAHPSIPADKAYTTWSRKFDFTEPTRIVPFADHSYLANKALWDEFFFSSMTPRPEKVPLFEKPDKSAQQVLNEFFLEDEPLPNRRIQAYKEGIDQTYLDALSVDYGKFSDGMADKIAAHLMVEGGFNVNSTSVEAWKVLFTSLRGKPLAYLDGGNVPKEAVSPEDEPATPVGTGTLPNAAPVYSAEIISPNEPSDQWKTGRYLTDDEIEKLAEAMVKQVKKRGPFLSLSEFVNRRLAANDKDNLALKGALQAALDDDTVPINANFREPERTLDAEMAVEDPLTKKLLKDEFAFPDAADGPVAYGSAAYVDQADVLRGLAGQLTPRGDTFVIRTYGDALDADGNVLARAWCEAVVQRVPDYVDGTDEDHTKTSLLLSEANRRFGRSFVMVGFRWLHPDEV